MQAPAPRTVHDRVMNQPPAAPAGTALPHRGSPASWPGLDSAEAARRLARHGPNELEDREHRGLGRTLRGIATEPMFLLLLVAAALYLALGDLGEGLLLAFFALITVGLVIFQERRSERALDALRVLAAPQARVRRDGVEQRLPARDLVPGDVFLVAEGERVAADGLVREAVGLASDESLLTGESVPVGKHPWAGDAASAPVPDDGGHDPHVSAGTLVVSGHAVVEVLATGRATRMGAIGASLATIETAATPLQRHLQRLVRGFGLAAASTSLALAAWYGLSRGDWLQGVLSAIALGMAMLPEEFPMALAVFLALGAWRLARIQVLSRRPAMIEALGGATLLCVDKTGTLTENRMRLQRLAGGGVEAGVLPCTPLDPAVHDLLEHAVLASRRGSADPMDQAVLRLGDEALAGSGRLHPDWRLEREYPLTRALLAVSHAWADPSGRRRVAAKGAPEAVLALCHAGADFHAEVMDHVHRLAGEGLRVLAVATADGSGGAPAVHPHDCDFRWLGLLAFEDPLRASVPAAVAQAREAGIGVAMITGDHAATALAVARQAGIDTGAGALTGDQLAGMDDATLDTAVTAVRVFARVQPEQKLRLVQAFQRAGEVVAMTGDGVNDAPALKAAHIGIAMGVRGTDVAREAAGLVLLDEDFGRIVGGVRMGRRIFDNLRKVMTYITAIHVPIAGLALLPVLLGLPPLMLPAHVVLTEMVIDPACTLAFEGAPEDPEVMRRPPRRSHEGILGWPMLARGLFQGSALLATTFGVYALALHAGRAEDAARALAIASLTAGNLTLVAVNVTAGLGWRALAQPGARALRWVALAAAAALALALGTASGRALLHFAVPSAVDLLAAVGVVAGGVVLAGAFGRPRVR